MFNEIQQMRYCIIHRIHGYEKKRRLVIQDFLQVDESLPCEALENLTRLYFVWKIAALKKSPFGAL